MIDVHIYINNILKKSKTFIDVISCLKTQVFRIFFFYGQPSKLISSVIYIYIYMYTNTYNIIHNDNCL
jgi:hypothetical protein